MEKLAFWLLEKTFSRRGAVTQRKEGSRLWREHTTKGIQGKMTKTWHAPQQRFPKAFLCASAPLREKRCGNLPFG